MDKIKVKWFIKHCDSYIHIQKCQECFNYCGNRIIVFSCYPYFNFDNFDQQCMNGFIWNKFLLKCIKCDESLIDVKFNLVFMHKRLQTCLSDDFDNNLISCEYCDLDSKQKSLNCGKCEKNQLNLFFKFRLVSCLLWKWNKITAKDTDTSSCLNSNTCVDNFQWKSSTQKFEKKICNYIAIVDAYLNLSQCQNCSITSYKPPCTNPCSKSQYYSQIKSQCIILCGNNGLISDDLAATCEKSNQCVDGFMWNNSVNKCERQQSCNQVNVNSNFNIYQCTNCILVTNTQLCSNTCQNSQYFSQLYNKYMKMCSNGQITETQALCQNSNSCVDGFQWNYLTQKCENQHICSQDTVDLILKIYQCPNCSLVTDTQLCNNQCLISQFYSSQSQCMAYCGNGIIAKDTSSVNNLIDVQMDILILNQKNVQGIFKQKFKQVN